MLLPIERAHEFFRNETLNAKRWAPPGTPSARDPLDVEQVRPMDAHERRRIEPLNTEEETSRPCPLPPRSRR